MPAVVRDEEGLAGLRARGVTRALTLWPEWGIPVRFLRKLHEGVENRPKPYPKSLQGRRIAIHMGKYVGGRAGGRAFFDGMASVFMTAACSGWKVYRPSESVYVLRRGSSTGLADGQPALQAIGLRDTAALRRLKDGTPAEAEGDITIRIPEHIVTSAIVATGVLSEVIGPTPNPPRPWMVPTEPDELDEPSCGWVFADIEILEKPIACPGMQGIWTL